MEKITARKYCAKRRCHCFGKYRLADSGKPEWRKLSNGYIGVVDGSPKNYVAPGMIFAIEMHRGNAVINSYTRNNLTGLAETKAYTLQTLYQFLKFKDQWTATPISFKGMIKFVSDRYPDIKMPTPKQFFAEYGLNYDEETGSLTKIVELADEE